MTDLLEQLKQMSNAERLELIEAATRLVRENLRPAANGSIAEQERRLQETALLLQDLYQPGGEHTEWTSLDGEEFTDDYIAG